MTATYLARGAPVAYSRGAQCQCYLETRLHPHTQWATDSIADKHTSGTELWDSPTFCRSTRKPGFYFTRTDHGALAPYNGALALYSHELLEHTKPMPPTNTHTPSNFAAGPHQPPLAEPLPYHGSLSSNDGVSAIPTIQEAPDKTINESKTAENIGQKGDQRYTKSDNKAVSIARNGDSNNSVSKCGKHSSHGETKRS